MFLKGLVKFMEIGHFEDFSFVLKLEFKDKTLVDVHQTVAHQPVMPFFI